MLAAANNPFARLFDEFVLVDDIGLRAGPREALRSPILSGLEELQVVSTPQAGDFRLLSLNANIYPRLKRLILNNLFLDDSEIDWLCESTCFPKLEELDLSFNRITNIGAETLMAAPFASRLRRLWLGNNLISDRGNLRLSLRFGPVLVDVLPPLRLG